jgi:hypothetical protein
MQVGAGGPATSFAARVTELLGKIQYRRVETRAELDGVLNLRYSAYLREGAIEASPDEKLVDPFDDLGNFVNFGVYLKDKLAGAVRIHVLDGPGRISPALDAFPDLLAPLLAKGKRIVDPNRYVVDYEIARLHPELAYVTIRLAVIAGFYYDANFVTATVRAEHQAFYRRSFFAKAACEPRAYPTLNKKIGLMLVDYENDRERILERGPYYASTSAEHEALFGPRPGEHVTQKRRSQSPVRQPVGTARRIGTRIIRMTDLPNMHPVESERFESDQNARDSEPKPFSSDQSCRQADDPASHGERLRRTPARATGTSRRARRVPGDRFPAKPGTVQI